jgi:hypothetical protein
MFGSHVLGVIIGPQNYIYYHYCDVWEYFKKKHQTICVHHMFSCWCAKNTFMVSFGILTTLGSHQHNAPIWYIALKCIKLYIEMPLVSLDYTANCIIHVMTLRILSPCMVLSMCLCFDAISKESSTNKSPFPCIDDEASCL